MTEEEKQFLQVVLYKAKKYKFRYIARNKNNDLWIYEEEPYKSEIYSEWVSNKWHMKINAPDNMFSFIKWEDKEPKGITKIIEENA